MNHQPLPNHMRKLILPIVILYFIFIYIQVIKDHYYYFTYIFYIIIYKVIRVSALTKTRLLAAMATHERRVIFVNVDHFNWERDESNYINLLWMKHIGYQNNQKHPKTSDKTNPRYIFCNVCKDWEKIVGCLCRNGGLINT